MSGKIKNRSATPVKRRRTRRLIALAVAIILPAVIFTMMHRLPPSLRKLVTTAESVVGKITQNSAGVQPAESVLRGTIYDHKYKELAVSYAVYSLYAQPVGMASESGLISSLSSITGCSEKELSDLLKSHKPVVRLAENLDRHQSEQIDKLGVKGIYCIEEEVRFYPAQNVGAHVLGFVGEKIGLAGLEGRYDVVLQPGQFMAPDVPELDIGSTEILGDTVSDIKLSLDLSLQKELSRQLQKYLDAQGLSKGIGILVNPHSGRILALSNLPGYNPNFFWQADAAVQEDKIYRQKLSKELITPILARTAAILREGLSYEGMLPQGIRAPNYGVSDEAIASLQKKIRLFAPVESSWESGYNDRLQAVRESIHGMESTLTGVQIEVALASLINGGWRIAPWMLEGLYDHGTGRTYPLDEEKIVRGMVLEPFSGVLLRRELFADRVKSKDGEEKKKGRVVSEIFTHSDIHFAEQKSEYVQQQLYVGMIPPGKPKYFLVMAVEADQLFPRPGSADDAVLNMDTVGEHILTRAIAADLAVADRHPGEKDKENMNKFFVNKRLDFQLPDVPVREPSVDMPELAGMSLRKALQRLGSNGLKVRIQGTGTVVGQAPAAGQSLQGITECTLRLEPGIY